VSLTFIGAAAGDSVGSHPIALLTIGSACVAMSACDTHPGCDPLVPGQPSVTRSGRALSAPTVLISRKCTGRPSVCMLSTVACVALQYTVPIPPHARKKTGSTDCKLYTALMERTNSV
jgi:hypothetical protein